MARWLALIRHGDDPPDDRVVTFAVRNGFVPRILKPFRGEALGRPDADLAGTVIYGGPFEVYREDDFPFLHDEARWIGDCMAAGVPVLGLCQGAQQIARLHGAHVGPPESGVQEFGCYRITPTAAAGDFLTAPLWAPERHFHGFDLPDGAVHLAESALYPHQAFRIGTRTYALQFHPEVTIEGFRRWQAAATATYGKPGVQSPAEQDALIHAHDRAQADWFYDFLGRLFGRG
ncbi:MAG: glutamine amidotransferase [Rhodobacteraceae bacterium]|nr:glutamine amidotransferase [Paracoccaceae bacterium]